MKIHGKVTILGYDRPAVIVNLEMQAGSAGIVGAPARQF
jgi:hypothetical protein